MTPSCRAWTVNALAAATAGGVASLLEPPQSFSSGNITIDIVSERMESSVKFSKIRRRSARASPRNEFQGETAAQRRTSPPCGLRRARWREHLLGGHTRVGRELARQCAEERDQAAHL